MSAPKRYTEEIRAEAVRRYMAGESSPKIAADIGCTNTTIMSWVNKSFTTPEMPETPKRSEDTMTEEKVEKVEMTVKETPAAAATATDEKPNVSEYSSYLYDSTQSQFCQVMINTIIELADDIISDDSADAEVAGYAGKISGLAQAAREVLRGE
jgi:transposase-like protein